LFSENNGWDYFISGGSNDAFDGYGGQDCIIIDDARPQMYEPEDWLKILDNNTSSLVKARYHNVAVQAKCIVMTSTIEPMNFFQYYSCEESTQFMRRCKSWVSVTRNQLKFYEYIYEINSYQYIKSEPNPIANMYPQVNHTEEEFNQIVSAFTKVDSRKEMNDNDGKLLSGKSINSTEERTCSDVDEKRLSKIETKENV